jgi:hypothetical protein
MDVKEDGTIAFTEAGAIHAAQRPANGFKDAGRDVSRDDRIWDA